MRRLALLRPALVGLALIVPAAAWADPPSLFGRRSRHLCPDCQMKAQMKADGLAVPPPTTVAGNVPAGAVVVENGNCAACQAAAGGAPVIVAGETPGRAVVGGGAPGYAMVGAGAEPAPIGVVQTSFRPDPTMGMPPRPGMPGGVAAMGPGAPMMGGAGAVPPAPTPMGSQHVHRTPFLARVLYFPRHTSFFEARDARRREAHAMIPYGDGAAGPVTDLPAGMVFGRGGPR